LRLNGSLSLTFYLLSFCFSGLGYLAILRFIFLIWKRKQDNSPEEREKGIGRRKTKDQ